MVRNCIFAIVTTVQVLTSNSLSVMDTTLLRKQVTTNNIVRNCVFTLVITVQYLPQTRCQ